MKLTELKVDPKNANQGNDRGGRMIGTSIRDYGAGRSVLVDKNGFIIAGNKTVAGALEAGLEEVLIVPSDGSKLIAVQRTDLDLSDLEARALAVADNRTAEINLEWDPAILAELSKEVDLSAYFEAEELSDILLSGGEELLADEETEWPTQAESEVHQFTVKYELSDEEIIKAFVGQTDDLPLSPIHTGKRVLERIKEIASPSTYLKSSR